MKTPAWAWVGVFICILSGAVVTFATVTVFHRQERCVQAVKQAQGASLSTFEAVETCQKREAKR